MKRLKVTHFLQDPCYCAVAASAAIVNYYDKNIDYEYTRELANKEISEDIGEEGLDTGEICLLLNYLGFNKVTLVSSDLDVFDYSWSNFGKKRLRDNLKKSVRNKEDEGSKTLSKNIYEWYRKDYNNNIIISYDFGKYIRQHLNKRKPILLTFNWTMFMRFAKEGDSGSDSINGEEEEHAVAVNGYDDNGVWIVDSHHQFYKYKRKKYRRGFYKIGWDNLFTCMGQGDVILPEEYIEE